MSLRPRHTVSKPQPQSITASAEKLADRLASKAGSQVGENWQHLALDMYDAVPELRAAARITGQSMSQCRLVMARVTDGEPAPFDIGLPNAPGPDANHPAQLLLEAFAGGQGGQSAWLDMLGVHLTVTGESISVGAYDTTSALDHPLATWTTYSPEQVIARNKVITVKTGDTTRSDVSVKEEEGITAVRIWRPHPRFNWKADSAAKAAIGAMQEIILYDQHIESSAISRLISAGLLCIPDGMTLPGLPSEDDTDEVDIDPFMRFLMTTMSTAIGDRRSAAARVPILLRGDKEDIAAIKQVMFDTPFDDKVMELRTAAIGRLAVAMDMPAAMLTGMEDLQHWTGALVTQDWVNNYLQALMSLACGSLTSGWLQPALLMTQGLEDYSDIIVWFDSSSVRVRENIGPETQWSFENGLIGTDTVRRVFGFDDSDKPTEEELNKYILLRMLEKSPMLAPLVFPLLGLKLSPEQLAEANQLAEALHHTLMPAGAAPGSPNGHLPNDPGNNATPSTEKTTPGSNPTGTPPKAPGNPAMSLLPGGVVAQNSIGR